MKWSKETSSEESTNGSIPSRARRRTIALATAFGVVAVSLAVLLSPYAGAVSAAMTTQTAPFTGEVTEAVYWSYTGCGTSVDVYKNPNLDLSSGKFTTHIGVSAASCGSVNSSEFAESQANLATYSWTASATGSFPAYVNWTVKDKISLSAIIGTSGNQFAGSYALVGAYAEIVDTTNNTTWTVGTSSHYYGNSASPTTHTYSYPLYFEASVPQVAGHTYTLVTGIYVEVNAFVSTGTSSASAQVNMATSGNHAYLKGYALP